MDNKEIVKRKSKGILAGTVKIDGKSLEEMEKFCLSMAEKGKASGDTGEDYETDEMRAARAEKELWEYKIWKSGLPPIFASPDRKWIPIPGTEEMTAAVAEYEKDWQKNIESGKNLIIMGEHVGTGKSRAMSYLAYKMLRAGVDIKCFSDQRLRAILSMESFNDVPQREWEIGNMRAHKVLMIDDYGAGVYTNPNGLERLFEIINDRWMRERTILINGNWKDEAAMKASLLERTYSRLKEKSILAVNTSEVDMRLYDYDKIA